GPGRGQQLRKTLDRRLRPAVPAWLAPLGPLVSRGPDGRLPLRRPAFEQPSRLQRRRLLARPRLYVRDRPGEVRLFLRPPGARTVFQPRHDPQRLGLPPPLRL